MQPVLGRRKNDGSCKLEPCCLNFATIKEETLLKKKRRIFILNVKSALASTADRAEVVSYLHQSDY